MAAITVVAAQVSPVKIYQEQTFIAAATISPGQVLYELAGGSVGLAKADAGSTSIPCGIAIGGTAYPGRPVSVMQRGRLNLGAGALGTAQAFGSMLYLSAGTAGQIVDTQPGSGNYKVPLGQVTTNSEPSTYPRLMQVDISFSTVYGTAAL
jgi:hypothetical protein